MSLLRRLEEALQSAIEGGIGRLDGGGVHPLEIARRLEGRMADARLLGTAEPYVPNRYVVRLSERDLAHLGEVADDVAEQIARHLERHAAEQGWAIGEGVSVQLEGGDVGAGRIDIDSHFDEDVPGARVVVIAGQSRTSSFDIGERAVIGRDPDCELRLTEPAVSRRHAEIDWTYAGYRLRDLGSSNGTFVNGAEIDEARLTDGDLIEVGLVQLRFVQRS